MTDITLFKKTLFVFVVFFFSCNCSDEKVISDSVLSNPNYFIAHAGGIIDGNTYTNSLEAFESAVSKGYKFIELDLLLTTDSCLVAVHDWKLYNEMTGFPKDSQPVSEQEFINRKILGKYTSLTGSDIVDLLLKYPQIILVTDKTSSVEILDKTFFALRNRVYVEAFSLEDYFNLKKVGYTPILSVNYIDQLKMTKELIFGKEKIEWICVSTSYNKKKLKMLQRVFKLKTAMYTSNDIEVFKTRLGKDADLIYTDSWDILNQTLSN